MGIPGLLPFLASVTNKQAHIRDFAGQTVAVDAYVWLHTGAHSCALELAQGIPTDKFVAFFMSRINLLLYHSVTPLVVFDGARLPAKRAEESSRAESRAAAKQRAIEHLKAGQRAKAIEQFQRVSFREISPLALIPSFSPLCNPTTSASMSLLAWQSK